MRSRASKQPASKGVIVADRDQNHRAESSILEVLQLSLVPLCFFGPVFPPYIASFPATPSGEPSYEKCRAVQEKESSNFDTLDFKFDTSNWS